METSVRYVKLGHQRKPVLAFRGRDRAYAVVQWETGIRSPSITLQDYDKGSIVAGPHGLGNIGYPIPLFAKRLLESSKPMTARAKFFLQSIASGGVEDNAVIPADEMPSTPGTLVRVEGAPTLGEVVGGFTAQELLQPVKAKAAPRPAPKPVKPANSSSGAHAKPVAGTRTAGADIVRKLAAELKLEPTKLRKLLRSKGLSAPYTDESKIRKALK